MPAGCPDRDASTFPRPGLSLPACEMEVDGDGREGPASSSPSLPCDQRGASSLLPVCTVGMTDIRAFLVRPHKVQHVTSLAWNLAVGPSDRRWEHC